MPRYDRSGPVGAGPRTGRGLGRCGRPDDRTAGPEDSYPDYRAGWFGRSRGGGRGRGFGGGGWGRRRGFGMGGRDIDDPVADDPPPRERRAFLRRKIQELTEQLDRVNELFSGDSRDDAKDQE